MENEEGKDGEGEIWINAKTSSSIVFHLTKIRLTFHWKIKLQKNTTIT
jgi:hypothetical protein